MAIPTDDSSNPLPSPDTSSFSLGGSLSDLATSTATSIFSGLSGTINSAVNGVFQTGTAGGTRGATSAPSPDFAAQAARPNGISLKASALGVSLPILIIGGGLILIILLKKHR